MTNQQRPSDDNLTNSEDKMPIGCAGAIKQGSFDDFVVRSAAVFVADLSPNSPLAKLAIADESPLSAELAEARSYLTAIEALTDEQAQAKSDAEYEAQVANRDAIRANRELERKRYEEALTRLLAWNPDCELFETLKANMVDDLTKSIACSCRECVEPPIVRMTPVQWRTEKMVQQSLLISHLERRNNHFMVLHALRKSLGIEQSAPT